MRKYFILLFLMPTLITGCDLLGQTGVYDLTTGATHPERGSVTPPAREFVSGTKVNLEATPFTPGGIDFGWAFVHWEGDISGTENPYTITISGDTEAIAFFDLQEYDLNITIQGEGQVTQSIRGSDGGPGEHFGRDYKHGTNVILRAIPATGWRFKNWQGNINDVRNPLERVFMWYEINETAVFEPIP